MFSSYYGFVENVAVLVLVTIPFIGAKHGGDNSRSKSKRWGG